MMLSTIDGTAERRPEVVDNQEGTSGGSRGADKLYSLILLRKELWDARRWQISPYLFQASGTQGEARAEPSFETAFRLLADQWRRETGLLSSVSQIAIHPAYQRIIGMGNKAIPLILQELEKRPAHWFWALAAITGENPVPLEVRGDVIRMADAWIRWGRSRGYISQQKDA